jgi:hypothetical protein
MVEAPERERTLPWGWIHVDDSGHGEHVGEVRIQQVQGLQSRRHDCPIPRDLEQEPQRQQTDWAQSTYYCEDDDCCRAETETGHC